MKRYFLDYAAGAPLHPWVREAMQKYLADFGGNPSAVYEEGRAVRAVIDSARETLASTLGLLFGEVVFTSGGTESAQLALLGVARASGGKRRRILIGAGDHHCIINQRPWLEQLGFQVDLVPIDRTGLIDTDAFCSLLGDDVLVVSLMHGQNETGVIADVAHLARLAQEVGALVLVDAVQTFPWLNGQPWKMDDLRADLLMLSGHKFGAPKGIGVLAVKGGTPIEPVLLGGGQERDMRAGTENVLGIFGIGEATSTAIQNGGEETYLRIQANREAFESSLEGFVATVPPGVNRLVGHCHGRFPGVTADSFLIRADREGIAASAGAACSSGSIEPSHVLLAAGWSEDEAREGLRFSFGGDAVSSTMTPDHACEAARIVNKVVAAIRASH